MKSIVALLLCLSLPVTALASANDGYKVVYDGGSLPDIKSGSGAKLFVTPENIRIVHEKTELVSIPPSAITEI